MQSRFRVIDGGEQPRQYRRKSGREVEPVCCVHCNGNTWIPVKAGMTTDGKTVKGGTKQLICAHCLAEGKVHPMS